MSEAPSSPAAPAPADTGAATERIDASCRVPLFVLFNGAAFWIFIASALDLVSSMTFHAPNLFADCAWLTYGRVHAAAGSALLYGFALQAGLGLGLWILAREGMTTVVQPWLLGFGAKVLNIGVFVGIVGILCGDATGFESLQMPRYGAAILFLGYLVVAVGSLFSSHAGRRCGPQASSWFLLTALLWFSWIYLTANLLLLVFPVRGVVQPVIAWWFSQGFEFVWLSLVGLAAIFHFVPVLVGRPLHSLYLAIFVYWTLILFGSWGGIPLSAPVPAWLPAISSIGTVLTLVTLIGVGLNVYGTKRGATQSEDGGDAAEPGQARCSPAQPAFAFLCFGLGMFQLSGMMRIIEALPETNRFTQFTWFHPAQSQLNLYGFFAMVAFGAIYFIVPRVTGLEWPWPRLARLHFWMSAAGVVALVAPLAIGGVLQGLRFNNPHLVPFLDISKATLTWLRVSSVGSLLIVAGNFLLLLNLGALSVSYYRTRFVPVYESAVAELKPAEVKP